MKGYVFLDVGGTQIKSAAFSGKGDRLGGVRSAPSLAREDRDSILSNFLSVIEEGRKCLLSSGLSLGTVGFAFPGPFDFEEGVSRMRGLNKYDAIFGVPLREALLRFPGQRIIAPDTRMFFRHDIASFALGEAQRSLSADTRRILCLCIGTGAGSAFLEDGKLLTKDPRVPDQGWIYPFPFQGARIDDWVSARGLEKVASEAGCMPGMTGKELYRLASEGDSAARKAWNMFGKLAADAVTPFVQSFRPQLLLLGGQISGALEYFGPAIQAAFPEIQITAVPDTTESTFRGLYQAIQENAVS